MSIVLMRWFLCGWLCLLSLGAAADGIVADGKGPVSIASGIDVLRDGPGHLDITEVARLGAQPDDPFRRIPGAFLPGYSRDVFWLRLTLSRAPQTRERWWLVVDPAVIDDLRFFAPDGHGSFVEQRAGDRVPVAQRSVLARETILPVELDTTPQTYYLRVQSTSTLNLSMALWQPEGWVKGGAIRYGLHGLLFGMLFAAILISAVSAVWLRQRFFWAAIAYMLFFGMQHMVLNGYDQLFIYPTQPMLSDRAVGVAAGMLSASYLSFVLLYLEPWQHCPRLTRWVSGTAWGGLAICGSALVGYFQYLLPFMVIYVGFLEVIAGVLLLAMRHHQPQRVVLLLMVYLPGCAAIIPQLLRNMGLLPFSFWTNDLWSLNVFLQMPFSVLIILQRVREEEKKRRDAQAQAQAQRKLLDMIAHELRTPLAVVETTLANIEVLTAESQPQLKPRFRRISLALARLNTLVDNALAEERLNAGGLEIHPVPMAPSVFLRQVHELAGSHDAHPLTLCLPDDDRPVSIDSHWLGLAVLNLIDNAIKYSPEGGAVALMAERVADRLVIRVTDHGIGIPPQALAMLGTRFFRAANAQALPGVRGMGLGLYLVSQVVARHGGQMRVESQPGQGSCFLLDIPVTLAGR